MIIPRKGALNDLTVTRAQAFINSQAPFTNVALKLNVSADTFQIIYFINICFSDKTKRFFTHLFSSTIFRYCLKKIIPKTEYSLQNFDFSAVSVCKTAKNY